MPTQFFTLEISDPFELWDWIGEAWLPGAYDEYSGGLGDTGIRLSESGFVQCSDGSYASGADACPPSPSMQCAPNEVSVSNPDWAGPVCMTSDMAIAFGKGLQQQATPAPQAFPWGWVVVGGVGLLLLGAVGGRRR